MSYVSQHSWTTSMISFVFNVLLLCRLSCFSTGVNFEVVGTTASSPVTTVPPGSPLTLPAGVTVTLNTWHCVFHCSPKTRVEYRGREHTVLGLSAGLSVCSTLRLMFDIFKLIQVCMRGMHIHCVKYLNGTQRWHRVTLNFALWPEMNCCTADFSAKKKSGPYKCWDQLSLDLNCILLVDLSVYFFHLA